MGVSEAVMAASSGANTVKRNAVFESAGINPALLTAAFSNENEASSSRLANVGVVPFAGGGVAAGLSSSLLQAENITAVATSSSPVFLMRRNIFIQLFLVVGGN
jgi:hypothetical protein